MLRGDGKIIARWIGLVIAGKLLGIGAAIWVGGTAISHAVNLPILSAVLGAIAVMGVAGFAEGTLVGLAQARVLGKVVPGIRSGSWAVTTGIATAAAWSLAMQANLLALDWELDAEALILLVILFGAALGTIVGAAQWLHLRSRLEGAGGWIAANAIAWVCGTAVAFAFLSFAGPDSRPVEVALVGLAAGVAVGAAVGVITGAALIGLLHHNPPHSFTR